MEEKESGLDDLLINNVRSGESNIGQKRSVSLTDIQAFFLRSILFDDEIPANFNDACPNTKIGTKQSDLIERRFNDEMLFTIPINPTLTDESYGSRKGKKRQALLLDLWRSHEKGIHPKQLIKRAKSKLSEKANSKVAESDNELTSKVSDVAIGTSLSNHSFDSDEEVRNEKKKNDDLDDMTESSSIEDEDVVVSYNPWEVLNDEYAEDFGFSYSRKSGLGLVDDSDDDNASYNAFKILGTSADDETVQPHVLSPPLMDALMTFLPEHLQCQNYWLRYSLVRDGANYETMKRYIHPCKFTIIAIETTKGEVFGSFTSTPWRTNLGFFGHIPAFVWKMRLNRRTKCTSLFERAQLESMIDVYMNVDKTQRIQLCRHDGFAVGGDETMPDMDDYNDSHEAFIASESSGFAIAMFDESLAHGTTSQSTIFKSPSLVGPGDRTETYTVAGLEVWTLTPAFDVASAERLEKSKYFVEESISRAGSRNNSSRDSSNRSQDFSQDLFYRRIGDDAEGERQRENSLYNDDKSAHGLGRSPRFPRKHG